MATILLIEDTPANLALAEKLLRAAGHEVLTSDTAASGIAMARDRTPDLVLLDLGLPDMDGWQALRRIRAEEGDARLRVIAFTVAAGVLTVLLSGLVPACRTTNLHVGAALRVSSARGSSVLQKALVAAQVALSPATRPSGVPGVATSRPSLLSATAPATQPTLVRFVLRNNGSLAHDLHVEKDGQDLGGTPIFGPGKTESGQATLSPGNYEFLCTGDPDAFRRLGAGFLQMPMHDTTQVTLQTRVAA